MTELRKNNRGFSLTEVLLAIGILSVGMTFIAGVFPVAIHLTTVATEQTIATAVADEAFAKVKLYAEGDIYDQTDNIDLSELQLTALMDFNNTGPFPATSSIEPNEFAYPSDEVLWHKQYFWSALSRLTEDYDPDDNPNPPVQVTVFVSRKVSPILKYYCPDLGGSGEVGWPTPDVTNRPVPVKIGVSPGTKNNELVIDNADEAGFINDGYIIVDDETGRIYRVLERYPGPDKTILLDRNWKGVSSPMAVWVVPPPVNGGRYPCIAVYQKVIGF